MRKTVVIAGVCLALAACGDTFYEQSQLGEDRYRFATWDPLTTYDEAADMFDAKAVEVCPNGHYVVSDDAGNLAIGGSYARVVRCVDYSNVKRPMPRPPGGP